MNFLRRHFHHFFSQLKSSYFCRLSSYRSFKSLQLMQSWRMTFFNDTDNEIRWFTDLNTIDLLTDAVMNRSDAVMSHTKEVEQKKSSDSLTWIQLTYLDMCNSLIWCQYTNLATSNWCQKLNLTDDSFTTDDQRNMTAIFCTLITGRLSFCKKQFTRIKTHVHLEYWMFALRPINTIAD